MECFQDIMMSVMLRHYSGIGNLLSWSDLLYCAVYLTISRTPSWSSYICRSTKESAKGPAEISPDAASAKSDSYLHRQLPYPFQCNHVLKRLSHAAVTCHQWHSDRSHKFSGSPVRILL